MSVYLRAARLVESAVYTCGWPGCKICAVPNRHVGCCEALDKARASLKAKSAFGDLFKRERAGFGYWWGDPDYSRPHDKNARVLALLFMHWMTQ